MSTTLNDWVPDTNGFDTRLALIRHRMGWNIKEAALACGVSPQSWREWELQNRLPRDYITVCRTIAAHSGCNRNWLMTGEYLPGRPVPGGDQPTGLYRVLAA